MHLGAFFGPDAWKFSRHATAGSLNCLRLAMLGNWGPMIFYSPTSYVVLARERVRAKVGRVCGVRQQDAMYALVPNPAESLRKARASRRHRASSSHGLHGSRFLQGNIQVQHSRVHTELDPTTLGCQTTREKNFGGGMHVIEDLYSRFEAREWDLGQSSAPLLSSEGSSETRR
jgi:hypothetical protein